MFRRNRAHEQERTGSPTPLGAIPVLPGGCEQSRQFAYQESECCSGPEKTDGGRAREHWDAGLEGGTYRRFCSPYSAALESRATLAALCARLRDLDEHLVLLDVRAIATAAASEESFHANGYSMR